MNQVISLTKKNEVKIFSDLENKYSIKIRNDIKNFIISNSGKRPNKPIILVDGNDYEIRIFLSIDENDTNYYIGKPIGYFLKNTKGKMIPLGLDSGDNYYCANNENGKIYYWSADDDLYYCIADSINKFSKLIK